MTVKEKIESKRTGIVYDKHIIAQKSNALRMYGMHHAAVDAWGYTNLRIKKYKGKPALYGTARTTGEEVMVCSPFWFDPDEEYNPYSGIYVGGYNRLFIKDLK